MGPSCQKLLQSSKHQSIKAHFDKERQKRNQHMEKLDDAKMHHKTHAFQPYRFGHRSELILTLHYLILLRQKRSLQHRMNIPDTFFPVSPELSITS